MKDRSFVFIVASVGFLAVLMLVANVRESKAPLYGPPTVDRKVVMNKVASGALSFTEARFYSREDDPPAGRDVSQRRNGP